MILSHSLAVGCTDTLPHLAVDVSDLQDSGGPVGVHLDGQHPGARPQLLSGYGLLQGHPVGQGVVLNQLWRPQHHVVPW